jgi:hypothetical protein
VKPKFSQEGRLRLGLWLVISFALLAGLAFLGFGSSQPALADGGVPPTSTTVPTVTPTFFLALPSPTLPVYPMATQGLPIVTTGGTPASSSYCWPIALTFIIVVMLASMVLVRKQS